jgi:hypothetical protein
MSEVAMFFIVSIVVLAHSASDASVSKTNPTVSSTGNTPKKNDTRR